MPKQARRERIAELEETIRQLRAKLAERAPGPAASPGVYPWQPSRRRGFPQTGDAAKGRRG